MRKRLQLLRQRDRAQSVGSVASPPYAAHIAPVSVGPAQSYASTPPQQRPSVLKHRYYRGSMGEAMAETWSSSDQCRDRDRGLVRYRDKDRDSVVHLDQDLRWVVGGVDS
ncbi:hypothetical protein Scep_009291 [Stephania cephalantha]|uniref:Uncharacterized protein n=1 Tax=Stephania cephalantha TaxID=152367 RepID=A0AAP0JTV5_9MAGN